ncbi:MAG: hypothetical protein R3F30_14405 [Planctomycetota bacterium]
MNRLGLSGIALAALAPMAMAGGEGLDSVRVPAAGEDAKVTFTPGKGFTVDGGDAYSLNAKVGMIVQYRFEALDNGVDDVSTFQVRNARLMMSGHVFDKDTMFKFAIESPEGSSVKDAWIWRKVWGNETMNLGVRVGLQKTLYDRETTGSTFRKGMTEYTLAGRSFAGKRRAGANVILGANDDKWRANFGIWNGDIAAGGNPTDEASLNQNNVLSYSLGFRYDGNGSMGDMSWTVLDLARSEELLWGINGGLFIGNEGGFGGANNFDEMYYTVGVTVKTKGFGGHAAFFGANVEEDTAGSQSVDNTGFSIILAYSMEQGYSVGGSISMFDADTPQGANPGIMPVFQTANTALSAPGDVMEWSLFVSRDMNGTDNRIIIEVVGQDVSPDTGTDDSNFIFRGNYVLVF